MDKIIFDCAIIGAGPAGCSAAIYLNRANKNVIMFEKTAVGGQILNSPKVENIPGFNSISGEEYGFKLLEQLEYNNINVIYDEVVKVDRKGRTKIITTAFGDEYYAKSVIIASGTKHRLLGLPNEEDLIGKGISFCVMCDGAFYRDRVVAVIGGGNSALQEALELSNIAKKVYIVQDLAILTGEQKLQENIYAKANIEIITSAKVQSYRIDDDNNLVGIDYFKEGVTYTLELDGVFLAIGLVPNNEPFKDVVDLDSNGYIGAINTFSGIYAAGDCMREAMRQVIVAESSGALVSRQVDNYLNKNYSDKSQSI